MGFIAKSYKTLVLYLCACKCKLVSKDKRNEASLISLESLKSGYWIDMGWSYMRWGNKWTNGKTRQKSPKWMNLDMLVRAIWNSIKLVNQMHHTESFDLNLGQLGLRRYISMPSTVESYYLTADPWISKEESMHCTAARFSEKSIPPIVVQIATERICVEIICSKRSRPIWHG